MNKHQLRSTNFLLFCFTLESIVIIAFFPNHGWAPYPLIARIVQQQPGARLDPPLYKPAPSLFVLDTKSKIINLASASNAPKIIIFFSGCRECSLANMQKVQELQTRLPNLNICLVIADSQENVYEFFRRYRLHLNAYSLYAQSAESLYNIAWYPRVFVLDRNAHLIYVQSSQDTFEIALTKARDIE